MDWADVVIVHGDETNERMKIVEIILKAHMVCMRDVKTSRDVIRDEKANELYYGWMECGEYSYMLDR